MRARAVPLGVAVLGLAAALTGALQAGGLAWAVETSTVTASLPAATATLQPPTSPSATVSCQNKAKGHILVSWTPTVSAFASGYTVTRSGGAAFTPVQLNAATTSYDDISVSGSTTYTYSVIATYQNWASTPAAVTATTAARC
ncbi:MAG TPA: hypothetical protein VFJ17_00945 [Mycobacteriales bacterium]|jgi:hypothetical protein|nr:hypothetical protein [Mycobacteriales bacterium]